jgi:TonB-linked SusC/RagA family outer membrane protein
MKKNLTSVVLLSFIMLFAPSFVHSAMSTEYIVQQTAKGISINVKKMPLNKVISIIERQCDYVFGYNSNTQNIKKLVTANLEGASISQVLNTILSGTGLKYEISGRQILLYEQGQAPESKKTEKTSGTVTDENGQPMPGVSVSVKGTTIGTVTDANGNYSLDVPQGSRVELSFIGYKSTEVKAGSSVKLSLEPDNELLNEVVVVGYGSISRKSLTGSVIQVKADNLNMVNAVSVDNLLQGKAAGLVVSQFTAQPGGAVNMSIRGGGEPLYVVDGVPLFNTGAVEASKIGPTLENSANGSSRSPLSTLNPNDIESIDVLKDAAATAIYGSAAANGVVLITTKKGKQGKPIVSYNGSVSIQKVYKKEDMLNGSDFRKYMDLARYEDWLSTNNYYPYGETPAPATGAPERYFTDEDIANAPTYDHFKEISRTGITTDHNVSISGGSENNKYFVSLGYYDQQSVLKSADFRRFSGRINMEQQFVKWLKLKINSLYSITRANNAQVGVSTDSRAYRENGNEAKMTGASLLFASDRPLEDDDGSLTINFSTSQVPNPLAYLAVRDMTNSDRFFFAPNLEATITNYLKANVVLGVDRTSADRDMWGPNRAKLPLQKEDNYGGFSKNYANNYSAEGYLTLTKNINNEHFISAVVGLGYYREDSKSYSLAAFNLPVEAVENYNLSLASVKDLDVMKSWKSQFTKISQFMRLNYSYLGRYILGLTARRDGSDSFPPSKKYGFFPGISVGWIISEEKFMSKLVWINNLKLRLGYGSTGNDQTVKGNYYYLNQFAYGMNYTIGNKLYAGVSQFVGKNDNFIWQTDETLNGGLDFTLFKGRLNGTLDVYQRTSKDLLGYTYPPVTSPVAERVTNVGSQRYSGIEFGLTGDIIKHKDFLWSGYINLSHYKWTWVDRDPNVVLHDWVGKHDEVTAYYGWKTDGIFHSREEVLNYVNAKGEMYQPTSNPGNIKYVDINNDGVLDGKDVVKLSTQEPKLNFGLGTSLFYKSFDLKIGTYGVMGLYTKDSWGYTNMLDMRQMNQSVYIKDVWTSFNPTGNRVGIKPDASLAIPAGDDFTLHSTWYLRLKNVTLGYIVPQRLLQKMRVYVDAQNLCLLTNYKGLDPEMERNNASPFPISFTISMGINVTF